MSFTDFYSLYPRKQGRRAAEKSWQRMTMQEQQDALEALSNHIEYWKLKQTEKDYIPHPATWLNQGRWEDELDMEVKKLKKPELPLFSENRDLELIRMEGNCVYFLTHEINGRFSVPNTFIETIIGHSSTTRNWNTIEKLGRE